MRTKINNKKSIIKNIDTAKLKSSFFTYLIISINVLLCCLLFNNATKVNKDNMVRYIKELEPKINWWLIEQEDLDKIEITPKEEKAPEYELISLGNFKLTGYCDCWKCQGPWVGTTAMGIPPTVNHTVAVDTSLISLGTHLLINGVEYVAEDVGAAIKGKRIDIFVGSHEETFSDFCNCTAEVFLIVR